MRQNAIYGAATDDSWRCPRDLTSIEDFGDHRYRLMGCGWLSDYECELPLQLGGIGAVVSGTSCRALTPPVPIHFVPPHVFVQQPVMLSPQGAVDGG